MRRVPTLFVRDLCVLAYSPIDARHQFIGKNERRWVDAAGAEVLFGKVAGLAICRESESDGVVLFGCDDRWRPLWETACTSMEVALAQAEFEYVGVMATWQRCC